MERYTYSTLEAVADISSVATSMVFETPDSRQKITLFIEWALEFEELHAEVMWGEDEREYVDEIYKFTHQKVKNYGKDNA